MRAMSDVLQIRGLCKSFGPVRVLRDVSLSLGAGRVLGLCGENGAGKSTLMRCATGALRPDAGEIRIDAGGEGRIPAYLVPQEFALVPSMTVAENILLGREIVRRGLVDRRAQRAVAAGLLAGIGAELDPDAIVGDLGVADRQKVEIARAFLRRARVIFFDEPTTVLGPEDSEALFETIRAFAAGGGAAVYVSHKLPEVLRVCDEVAVLRDGELVAHRSAKDFTPATLAEAMVGRPLSRLYPPKAPWRGDEAAPPALEAEGLSDGGRVRRASLRLRAGEILGLAGLAGAGRTEFVELLCGISRRKAGTLRLFGRPVRFRSPAEALAAGVAVVPEDRQGAGVLPDFSVADNVALSSLRALRRGPFVSRRRRDALFARLGAELRLKAEGPDAPARSLSGGNQQKAVVAKGLAVRPRVFLFDEPTRGVDVGARADLYEILHRLAAEGMAVLLVSSDLEEVIGNCDRVVVMRDGETVGEVSGADVAEKPIVRLAHGV